MATKSVLLSLASRYAAASGQDVQVTAIGGVDALKRMQSGEQTDIVVLASKAIEQLVSESRVLAGSRVDLVKSGVYVAIPDGASRPDISSEAALKALVVGAVSVGFSTGPSGVYLERLFSDWGITEQVRERLIQAPPGVPVASLIAQGKIAVGFQQLSELQGVPGVHILGPLPPAIQLITTFSGAVASSSRQTERAHAVLQFIASPETAATKSEYGMQAP